MSSFIFDNFKKRFLTGGVPQTDTWHFIPVNEDFKTVYEHDDVKLYHYRNINDFNKANSSYLKFTLSPEAKKFNDELTTEYYVKGLKGFSLDEKKNWQPTSIWGTGILDGNKITRTWYKVLDDNDFSNKPMFVKGKNFRLFSKIYGVNLSGNTAISSYIESGGFYYIRSKDELTWFANRANTGNNKIIGVLGDNIEGVINGDPIGKDEANPFQGILDGNGFTLKNISVECNNVDNGLVGVLGKYGTVKNFTIDNAGYANSLVCKKKINLKHIKEDARDINAGILVGRNYGTIKNINALNMKHFNFYGFVPEVYSVTNKSDDYSWEDGKVRKKFDTSNSNYYLMNSFCVNSPGNVCPYIGYFAEGYYGEDHQQIANVLFYVTGNSALPYLVSGVSSNNTSDTNSLRTTYTGSVTGKIWNLQGHNPFRCVADTLTSVNFYVLNDTVIRDDYNTTATNWQSYLMGNWFGNLSAYTNTAVIADPNDKTIFNMASQMAKSPTYYGLDSKGFYTCGIICNESGTNYYTRQSNLCYNTNLIQDTLGLSNEDSDDKFKKIICPSAYVQTSLRMNPLTRAAYNIGIIAGANYGSISNVSIKVTAQNTSNFVGFYGTIAGKQANGYINLVNVDVDNQFIWDGEDYSYNVTYKNTPILPQKLKQQFSMVQLYGGKYTASSNFDYYFSAFYDNDPSVNTATDITDDCVTYRLRPIIVAGGLFGRYIPTVEKSIKPGTYNFANEGCYVNAATVIYNDNFESTNWKNGDYYGNYKRLENAMGVIAGKCDVGTQGVGVYENEILGSNKMFVTNSIFSAVSSVGPLAVAYPVSGTFSAYTSAEATAHKTNGSGLGYLTVTNNNVTSVKSTLVNTKYIGIYEIKQNVLETMCVSIDSNAQMASADELKTGKDTGYLYTSDYPFRILNNTDITTYNGFGTFYPNNNFANQRTNGNEGNPGATLPVGYNKRNIASWLIHLEGCRTNISPAVILYDDYLNTWYDGNTAADNWSCNGNYTTKRAWFVNTTDTRVQDVFRNASTFGWQSTYAADYEVNEINAIQNTFDGYTFIRTVGAYGQMNYKANGISRLRSNFEAWFTSLNSYHNPRQYEKNIMVWSSPDLCPGNFNDINADGISGYTFYGDGSLFGVDYLVGSTSSDSLAVTDGVLEDKNIFNRSKIDDFFYYTYTDTDIKYYTNTSALPINDSLVQHEEIKFGVYDGKMGYYKTVDSENVPYRYSYYGIGENLSANQIRNRIIEKGTFTTTSISSNKNFGGLLVIDSSGNNVMFLDNTNQAPLTGNAITYPTPLMDTGKQLLMLEVK